MTSRMLQIPITRIVSICWAQQSHNLSIVGQHRSVQCVSLPFTKYPIASHSNSDLISYAKPIASTKCSDLISMPTLLLQPRIVTLFSIPILFCFLVLQTRKATFLGQIGTQYLATKSYLFGAHWYSIHNPGPNNQFETKHAYLANYLQPKSI